MSKISRTFIAVYILIVLVWVWAALNPSHFNWGVHLFAFFPIWYQMVCLGLLLGPLVPAVRNTALNLVQVLAELCSRLNYLVLFLIIGSVFSALVYFFPAKLHLLGDGDIILQLTPKDPYQKDVSNNFRDQPLVYSVVRLTQIILGGGSPVEIDYTYHVLDWAVGLIFIALVVFFIRSLKLSPVERLLAGCLIVCGARLQFFFGYVENYSLLCIFLTAFMISGWLTLKQRLSAIIPVLFFLGVVGVHLGSIVLLPGLLVIFVSRWRTGKKELLLSFSAAVLSAVILYFLFDYNLQNIAGRIAGVLQKEMLPLTGWRYAVFSSLHALDWLNAHALIMPFGVIAVLIFPVYGFRTYPWREPLLIFLLLTAAGTLGLTFIISPALGMARDWDLMAVFFIPCGFLSLYFFLNYLQSPDGKQVLLLVVALQVILTVTWIGVNADERKHLQRAEMLTNPALGGTIPTMYYEGLARLYLQRGDYQNARVWYQRYLSVDSFNVRILGNLSDLYMKLGDHEKAIETLERTARAGNNPAVYSNLSVEYLRRKDTTSALEALNRAVELDSNLMQAHANLAVLYFNRQDNKFAAFHSTKAILYGMADLGMLKLAGTAYYRMNDVQQAALYFNRYLAGQPNDENIRAVVKNLQRIK